MKKNISITKLQKTIFHAFLLMAMMLICTCTVNAADKDSTSTPADIPGLTYDHSMELSYAQEFSVDYYNDATPLSLLIRKVSFW